MSTDRYFGWKKDQLDHRDHWYGYNPLLKLPAIFDMRKHFSPAYNQGRSNSCTGNAVAGACQYELLQHSKPYFNPSRLFIYYNTRVLENSVGSDSGATIRNSIKSVNKWGFCDEKYWLYTIPKVFTKPTSEAYSKALSYIVTSYGRVNQSRQALQLVLASYQPIIFGFSVYDSFTTKTVDKTGVVPMPGRNERRLGGHAVLLVGYDDARQRYIFRNSYGTSWGDKGYGYLPYNFLENPDLAGDFWVVKSV